MRCPRSRSAAALLLALALCTCTDAPTGPRQVLGRLALAPTYSREAREIARNLSAADLPLNKIFVEVRSADNEVRGTELVDFPLDQQEITLKVDVKLKTSAEQLAAKVELRSGEIPIFSSTTQLVVTPKQTGPAPTEPLTSPARRR